MLISALQQYRLAMIIQTSPPSFGSLPCPHPTPPPRSSRAPDWAPCATPQPPTS